MFLVYSLLFTLGVVFTAPYYLWRLRGRIFSGAGWRERFGFLPLSLQQKVREAIWVHAVSVGETLAVTGLVRELRSQYPGRKIFLSHVTPAGREAGESRFPEVEGRFFLPLDWPWCVRRAFDRIRPAVLLIVETELWPNLLRAARESGTRTVLVNARLSARSFRRYHLARPFLRRILENVDLVCAQSAPDAERFRLLGAPADRVVVTGNIKFDSKPPERSEFQLRLAKALSAGGSRPVIVAASTMSGEEELLLRAFDEIRRAHPEALLILAPRHPARFETVARFLAGQERKVARRTALEMNAIDLTHELSSAEVLLLDTIGELAGILELADVVFVGGSLVPTGGHNPLEPAFWAKAILFGPHMENFRDVAELFLGASAAVRVNSARELAQSVSELVANPARRREIGNKARQVLDQQRGATLRTIEYLKDLLSADVFTHTSA